MWDQWWGLVCHKADGLAGWHSNTNQVMKLNSSSQQRNLKYEFHHLPKHVLVTIKWKQKWTPNILIESRSLRVSESWESRSLEPWIIHNMSTRYYPLCSRPKCAKRKIHSLYFLKIDHDKLYPLVAHLLLFLTVWPSLRWMNFQSGSGSLTKFVHTLQKHYIQSSTL